MLEELVYKLGKVETKDRNSHFYLSNQESFKEEVSLEPSLKREAGLHQADGSREECPGEETVRANALVFWGN